MAPGEGWTLHMSPDMSHTLTYGWGSKTRKPWAPHPALTLTVQLIPRDPAEAPGSPCHRPAEFWTSKAPARNSAFICPYPKVSSLKRLSSRRCRQRATYFEVWSHSRFGCCLFTATPPCLRLGRDGFFCLFVFCFFRKRYRILLLEVLLVTVARESWVQPQTH